MKNIFIKLQFLFFRRNCDAAEEPRPETRDIYIVFIMKRVKVITSWLNTNSYLPFLLGQPETVGHCTSFCSAQLSSSWVSMNFMLMMVGLDKNNTNVSNGPPIHSSKQYQGTKLERLPHNKSTTKWKLWHEIAPEELDSELERAFKRAAHYGKVLGGVSDVSKFHNNCPSSGEKPMLLGKGGEHMVSTSFGLNSLSHPLLLSTTHHLFLNRCLLLLLPTL